MFKKVLILLIAIVFIITLAGCKPKKDNDDDKNYIFNALKYDLMKIDPDLQMNSKEASLYGAKEGYEYVLSGCTLEVYKFDKKSEEYKKSEEDQRLYIPSMNLARNATVKNGYAYFEVSGVCIAEKYCVKKLVD